MRIKKSIISAAIFLSLFIILAILVVNKNVLNFNNAIIATVGSWHGPILTKFMIFITYTGEWFVYLPIIAVLLIFPKTRMKYGVPLFLMLFMSAGFNTVIKHALSIPRPEFFRLVEETGYGFPSGHSMNSMVFIGFFAFLIATNHPKKQNPYIIYGGAALLILLIGLSRIYLGVHNPTDIIGGYLFGLFLISIGVFLYNKIKPRIKKFY